jgi:glycyl-tRNA synthetase (class II)
MKNGKVDTILVQSEMLTITLHVFWLQVSSALTLAGLSNIIDTTGNTIGKRYARTDEIGVPYAVTVDFDSLAESGDSTVTLRERDTMTQVRVGGGAMGTCLTMCIKLLAC